MGTNDENPVTPPALELVQLVFVFEDCRVGL